MIDYFEKGVEAGYKRYIIRSIKREVWNGFREQAEEHAIKVFATNLKNLKLKIFDEGIFVKFSPDAKDEQMCIDYGKAFGEELLKSVD